MRASTFVRVVLARAIVTLALTLLLSACKVASGSSSHSAESRVLKWATDFPANWDPIVQGSGGGFRVLALAYASLTEIDAQGNAQPGLAKSWDYNEVGNEVTFHLRPGLKFSDGTPVNAEAVKLYLERAKAQRNSALQGDLTSIESVRVVSDLDVVLHLTQIDHQIPLLLGQRVAQITSPKAAQDLRALNGFPVGAGPFTVVELVPESHVFLKKNPDYWNAAQIFIDEVKVYAGTDPAMVVSSIQTGVYDFASLNPSQVKAAESAGLDVVVQPGFNAANLAVNRNKKPFDDPRVLEAVRYAINRQEFVDKVTLGYGSATNQPFPKGYVAYDEESANLWPYDPEKAKQLLKEAGYQANSLTVDFVLPASSPAAEVIQAQLARVGISAKITISRNWAQAFFAKELSLSVYGTTGRESPVQTLTAHFGPDGPLNLSSPFVSDEFLTALKVARATPLGAPDYAANLRKATRAALKTTPLIFTYSLPNLFVKSPRVSKLPAIPGQIHWTGVKLEKR
ncbi:MAG: ABC transporter substrate-binding protein [Pseudomonadota bacterium]